MKLMNEVFVGKIGTSLSFRGVPIIARTGVTPRLPLLLKSCCAACCTYLVSLSRWLPALRASQISNKSIGQNCSRATAMSIVRRYAVVRKPLKMTSKRYLESEKS